MQRRSFLNSLIWLGFEGVLARPPQQQTRPALVKPRRLRQGDKVALINPAGATAHRMDIEIVQESLEALGLRVKLGEHVMDRRGYLAGSDEDRAADVNRQFEDSSVAGIVAVRGGWGCARILPLLDYQLIGRNPKILVGYSDVTALLLGIHSKTGLITFHGPAGIGPWNSFTVEHFTRILFEGQAAELSNPRFLGDNLTQVQNRIQTIVPGVARGRMLGGNLTVLSAIVGSSYLPDWNDAILFLEDIQENIYRVDRMLTQLALAGILDEINGFVFGNCTGCGPGESYGSLTIEQVLADHVGERNLPSWRGAMIGHISQKFTIPQGIPAEIDATTGRIQLSEAAVV